MWSMLTQSHYTKVDSAHRRANTHHVTEPYAFSTSLRNKNLKFDYKQPLAPWPSHNGLGCLGQFPCSAWGILPPLLHPPPPPPPPALPPDQCGYACLLCLNSGSVAPLVGLSIMMLRIISCSVKGYTSLSLVVFVPKHHYMHVSCVCVCVLVWPFLFYSSDHHTCSIRPLVHWRPALYEHPSGSACCLDLPGPRTPPK